MNIDLTAQEVAVIWEFLRNVRLGNRNPYEKVISDLMIDLEKSGIEDRLNGFYTRFGLTPPEFMVESNNDGFVINVI